MIYHSQGKNNNTFGLKIFSPIFKDFYVHSRMEKLDQK